MKRNLMGLAAVIAAAGLTSLFTARRIEAQYSSPVKVVNTNTGPAVTSNMDDPGRIPYQSLAVSNGCGTTFCTGGFAAVPAGHRLVITQFAGNGYFTSSAGENSVGIFIGGQFLGWSPPILPGNQNSFVFPAIAYVDAGQSVSWGSSVTATTFSGAQNYSLTGYLLDCTAAPCAPIAH